jgi:hypothetical protein
MDIKIAEGVASALHKLDAEALREALNITAEDKEVDDKKFFDFLQDKQGTLIKEREKKGFDRAKSTVLSDLEKQIRKEFSVDDAELQGVDLVRHIADTTREAAEAKGGKSGKLTDDDVKKHPLFIDLEKAKKKEVEDLKKDFDTKIKAKEDEREYDKLLTDIDSEADKIFSSIGEAVLPEDASIAAKHKKRLLIDELRSFKFQKSENGDIVVLNADGTRHEDKAGNAKGFKDLVSEIAKQNFQFKAGQERKLPGNGNPPPGGNGGGKEKKYTGNAPKDASEYVGLLINGSITAEQKQEIKETYGPQFQN